jgi:hypothetical protein
MIARQQPAIAVTVGLLLVAIAAGQSPADYPSATFPRPAEPRFAPALPQSLTALADPSDFARRLAQIEAELAELRAQQRAEFAASVMPSPGDPPVPPGATDPQRKPEAAKPADKSPAE